MPSSSSIRLPVCPEDPASDPPCNCMLKQGSVPATVAGKAARAFHSRRMPRRVRGSRSGGCGSPGASSGRSRATRKGESYRLLNTAPAVFASPLCLLSYRDCCPPMVGCIAFWVQCRFDGRKECDGGGYVRCGSAEHRSDYCTELADTLFDNALEDTNGWTEATLLDIANYKNGLAMQKFRPEGDDPGLPVLIIKELGQGACGDDAERCRSDIDESVHIHDGDLIFSWLGALLLDYWAGGDTGLNQHLFKVTSDKYPSWFFYMWTKYHMRKFIALAKDRATTMGHIKRSALAEAEVLISPKGTLDELTTQMQPVIDQMVGLKVEARKRAVFPIGIGGAYRRSVPCWLAAFGWWDYRAYCCGIAVPFELTLKRSSSRSFFECRNKGFSLLP